MKAILFISFIAICSLLNAQDFRKVNWGMTKEQVKKLETAKIKTAQNNLLGYEVTVNNSPAVLHYIFSNNVLIRSKYLFAKDHYNKNDFIKDYASISKLLKTKYGKPIEDKTIWENNLYSGEHSKHGFAISIGHLHKYESWKEQKTKVKHILTGDNHKITHAIEYTSTQHIEEKKEKKSVLDDL